MQSNNLMFLGTWVRGRISKFVWIQISLFFVKHFNLSQIQTAQRLLAPFMQIKLQELREFAISKSAHNFAQFASTDPGIAKNVHPNFCWDIA